MGKEHIYIIEEEEDWVHEEEAALRIGRAVAGDNLKLGEPKQGRVNIKSTVDGVLKINKPLLYEINSIEDIVLATLHNNSVCQPETIVAGTKIIPLYTSEDKISSLEELCKVNDKVLNVLPFRNMKVGLLITATRSSREG
jgi:hypothetical protein